jgi:3-carboxy-cis,cis-muconate cycloisomerase
MSDSLLGPMFGTPGGDALLAALLETEAALARAQARYGVIPAAAAETIAACCRPGSYDAAELGRRAVRHASMVVPLVAELRARAGDAGRYVHQGATSQDVVDTALSLVAARRLDAIGTDLAAVADALAALADDHRATVQIGRTLLQQALPTTFGLVCAGWLVGVDEARAGLSRVRAERLAVQLGGPVGTVADLGGYGVVEAVAADLGLAAPVLPWHTTRNRVAELAAALGIAAGALATVALDVALLSQGEVGELAEADPGGSSAMPHKRNPARAVLVTACAHRAPGLVATILAAQPQEYQRAAGRWQAEWPVLTDLLGTAGAAAGHARAMLTGLRVDTDRMRANAAAAPAPDVGGLVDRALRNHREQP